MASKRWASGSVAGVALVDSGGRDLRTDVVEAEALNETLVGNATEALDLTVHTQVNQRNMRGVHFGIRIAQIPTSTLLSIVAAIEAAVGGGNGFPVILSDDSGADDISVTAVPDWGALDGKLYRRGKIAADYAFDVQMRFISTGTYVPPP